MQRASFDSLDAIARCFYDEAKLIDDKRPMWSRIAGCMKKKGKISSGASGVKVKELSWMVTFRIAS